MLEFENICVQEVFYRRHSALRTINGGMCSGLTFRLRALAQLLLLGYQRIVNGSIFKGNLFFLNLPNIANPLLCTLLEVGRERRILQPGRDL